MSAAAVSSTTGYINYVYNVEAKGVSQLSSEIMGASGAINNMLGQLAFQTSAYLSRTESAAMSMGIVATAGLYKATQQAIKFDYAMQGVQAIAGKNNIGNLGDQAMEMSNKFGVAVDKMVKGLESLARAGVSPQNMSGILEQAMGLSKLEDLDLNTAINDLLSTTNLLDTKNLDLESPEYVEALKYQNQKITATSEAAPINAQDIIHTLEHVGGYASSTNIDQDDLYAVIAQLGSKGTRSELAGTSLRAFLAAGQKDTAQRALKRIGLNVSDLWKNDDTIMSISDMKDVLDEAMDERGYSKQERLEFYSDFVGYKQANQVMKIDTASVRDYKNKIDQSLDINEKINMVLNTTQTRLQNIFQTGKNFLTKVGQPIMFALDQILKPINFVVGILDKIPGLGIALGITTILAAMKGVATIFNKLAPMVLNVTNNFKGIRGYIKDAGEELSEMVSILRNHGNKDFIAMKVVKNEIEHIGLDDIKTFLPQLKDLPAHMQNTFAQMFEFNLTDTDREQIIKMKTSMFEKGYYDPTELSTYTSDALTKVNKAIYTYNQENYGNLNTFNNEVSDEVKNSISNAIIDLSESIRDASEDLDDNIRGVTNYQGIGLNVDAIKSAALVSNGSAYEYGMVDFFHELAHNLLKHDQDNKKSHDLKDAEAIAFSYKLADIFGVHYDKNWRRKQEATFNVDQIKKEDANKLDELLQTIRDVPSLQKDIITGYNKNVESLGLDIKVPKNFAMFGGISEEEDFLRKAFQWNQDDMDSIKPNDSFADFISKSRSIPNLIARLGTRVDEWISTIDAAEIGTSLSSLKTAIDTLAAKIQEGIEIKKYVKVDKVARIDDDDKKVFTDGFKVEVDLAPITEKAQKTLEEVLKVDASDAEAIVEEIEKSLHNVSVDVPELSKKYAEMISATANVKINKQEVKDAVKAGIEEKIEVSIDPNAINQTIIDKLANTQIQIDKSNADEIIRYIVYEIINTKLEINDEKFIKDVLGKLTDTKVGDDKDSKINIGTILNENKKNIESILNILKDQVVDVNIVGGGVTINKNSGGGSDNSSFDENWEAYQEMESDRHRFKNEVENHKRHNTSNLGPTIIIEQPSTLLHPNLENQMPEKPYRKPSKFNPDAVRKSAERNARMSQTEESFTGPSYNNERSRNVGGGQQVEGKPIVFFDVETTGKDKDSQIIQIGAVKLYPDGRQETYKSLVKPENNVKISPDAVKIHGITDEMLVDAPKAKQVANEFEAFIADAGIMGGHNVNFDAVKITKFLKDTIHYRLEKPMIDTLAIANDLLGAYKDLSGHSNEDIGRRLNNQVDSNELHDALNDTILTVKNFASLKKIAEEKGRELQDYINIISYPFDRPDETISRFTYVHNGKIIGREHTDEESAPSIAAKNKETILTQPDEIIIDFEKDGFSINQGINISSNKAIYDLLSIFDAHKLLDFKLGKNVGSLSGLSPAVRDFIDIPLDELLYNIHLPTLLFSRPETSDVGTNKVWEKIDALFSIMPQYVRFNPASLPVGLTDQSSVELNHSLMNKLEGFINFLQTKGILAAQIHNSKEWVNKYGGSTAGDRYIAYSNKISGFRSDIDKKMSEVYIPTEKEIRKRNDGRIPLAFQGKNEETGEEFFDVEAYKKAKRLQIIRDMNIFTDEEYQDFVSLSSMNIPSHLQALEYYRITQNKPMLDKLAVGGDGNAIKQIISNIRPDIIEYGLADMKPLKQGMNDYIASKFKDLDHSVSMDQFYQLREKFRDEYMEMYANNIVKVMQNEDIYSSVMQYANDIYESAEWKVLKAIQKTFKERGLSDKEFMTYIRKEAEGTAVTIEKGDSLFTIADKIRQSSNGPGLSGTPLATISRLVGGASMENGAKLIRNYRENRKRSSSELTPGELAILQAHRPFFTTEGKESELQLKGFYTDILNGKIDNPFGDKVYNKESLSDNERFLISSVAPMNATQITDVSNLKISKNETYNTELINKVQEIYTILYRLIITSAIEHLNDSVKYIQGDIGHYSFGSMYDIAGIVKDVYVNKTHVGNIQDSRHYIDDNYTPDNMQVTINTISGPQYGTPMSAKGRETQEPGDLKERSDAIKDDIDQYSSDSFHKKHLKNGKKDHNDLALMSLDELAEEDRVGIHRHKIANIINRSYDAMNRATRSALDITGSHDQAQFTVKVLPVHGLYDSNTGGEMLRPPNVWNRQDGRMLYDTDNRVEMEYKEPEDEYDENGNLIEKPVVFNYGNTVTGVNEDDPNSLPFDISLPNEKSKNMQPEMVTAIHIARRLKSRENLNASRAYFKVVADMDPLGTQILKDYSLLGQVTEPSVLTADTIRNMPQGPFMEHSIKKRFAEQFFPSLAGVKKYFEETSQPGYAEDDYNLFVERLTDLFMNSGNVLDPKTGKPSNTFATKISKKTPEELSEEISRLTKEGKIIGKPMFFDDDKTKAYVWNVTKLFNNMDDTAFGQNIHMLTTFMLSLTHFSKMLDGVANQPLIKGLWGVDEISTGFHNLKDGDPNSFILNDVPDEVMDFRNQLLNIFDTKKMLNNLYLDIEDPGSSELNYELISHLANVNDDIYEYLQFLDFHLQYEVNGDDLNKLANEIGDTSLLNNTDKLIEIKDQMSNKIHEILYTATILREMSDVILPMKELYYGSMIDPLNGSKGILIDSLIGDMKEIKENDFKSDIYDVGHSLQVNDLSNNVVRPGVIDWVMESSPKDGRKFSFQPGFRKDTDYIIRNESLNDIGKSDKTEGALRGFNSSKIGNLNIVQGTKTGQILALGEVDKQLTFKENYSQISNSLEKDLSSKQQRDLLSMRKNVSVMKEIHSLLPLIQDMSDNPDKYADSFHDQIRKYFSNLIGNLSEVGINDLNVIDDIGFKGGENYSEAIGTLLLLKENNIGFGSGKNDFIDIILNNSDVINSFNGKELEENLRQHLLGKVDYTPPSMKKDYEDTKEDEESKREKEILEKYNERAYKNEYVEWYKNLQKENELSLQSMYMENDMEEEVTEEVGEKKNKKGKRKGYNNGIANYLYYMVKHMQSIDIDDGEQKEFINELIPEGSNVNDLLNDSNSMFFNFVNSLAGTTIQGLMKDYANIGEQEKQKYLEEQKERLNLNVGESQSVYKGIKDYFKDQKKAGTLDKTDPLYKFIREYTSQKTGGAKLRDDILKYRISAQKKEEDRNEYDDRIIKEFEDTYFNGSVNILEILEKEYGGNKYGRPNDFMKYLFENIKYGYQDSDLGRIYDFRYIGSRDINSLKAEQFSSINRQSEKKKLNNDDVLDSYRSGDTYANAKKRLSNIQGQGSTLIGHGISSLYRMAIDNTNIDKINNSVEIFNDMNTVLNSHVDTIRSWNAALYDFADIIPGLSLAVLGLEQILNTVTMAQKGISLISSLISMGAGGSTDVLKPIDMIKATIGKALGNVFSTISEMLIPYIIPLTAIASALTVSFFAVKGALDWSFQSHQKYMKTLEEEQKEHKSSSRSLQATVNQTRKLAEKNTNPIKQAQRERKYELARVRLQNANMSRASTAIDMTRAKNDVLWGDYGISAGLSKLGGNYESTAEQYEGTSQQTRLIKEATLANPFSTGSMTQVARYYDANQLAFGQMDEYKSELGALYDEESRLVKKYDSVEEARKDPKFEEALDRFVEATGITRDHAQQYLDYMQTEHNVNQAKIAMQAESDKISSETEMKIQAIQFGGNPADVLGLNGIEAQQSAMVKAQADMIKIELSGQLWWKAVWSTIVAPVKLIMSPLFMIVDILGAIWSLITGNFDNAFALGGKAISRMNVLAEPATYWSAWGQVESTDFASIGESNIDETSRANYGNGPTGQGNVGRNHGTNLINNKKGGGLFGLFGGKQGGGKGGSAFKDHKDVVKDNAKNSFLGGLFGQVLSALGGIAGTLTSIAFLIGGGFIVKELIGGLIGGLGNGKGISINTESIKNALSGLGGLGGKIGNIFKKVPGLDKIGKIFENIPGFEKGKELFGNIKLPKSLDNLKDIFGKNLGNIKYKGFGASIKGLFSDLKKGAKYDIDKFKSEHPTIGGVMDNYAQYGRNKIKGLKQGIKGGIGVGSKWSDYIQGKISDHGITGESIKEKTKQYGSVWGEYAKNQIKDRFKIPDFKEKIGIDKDSSIIEMLKDPQKIEDWAKGKIKNKINSYDDNSVVGRYRNRVGTAKRVLSDPEEMEKYIKGKAGQFKARGEEELAWADNGGLEASDMSLAGKVAKFKRDKLGIGENESLDSILSNPERAVEIGKKGYSAIKEHGFANTAADIVGSTTDGTGVLGEIKSTFGIDLEEDLKEALNVDKDLSVKDALKDKISDIFSKENIEEAVEEGVDEEDNGESFINKAKQKLTGLFSGGEKGEPSEEDVEDDTKEIPSIYSSTIDNKNFKNNLEYQSQAVKAQLSIPGVGADDVYDGLDGTRTQQDIHNEMANNIKKQMGEELDAKDKSKKDKAREEAEQYSIYDAMRDSGKEPTPTINGENEKSRYKNASQAVKAQMPWLYDGEDIYGDLETDTINKTENQKILENARRQQGSHLRYKSQAVMGQVDPYSHHSSPRTEEEIEQSKIKNRAYKYGGHANLQNMSGEEIAQREKEQRKYFEKDKIPTYEDMWGLGDNGPKTREERQADIDKDQESVRADIAEKKKNLALPNKSSNSLSAKGEEMQQQAAQKQALGTLGQMMDNPVSTVLDTQSALGEGTIYCPECGYANDPDSTYCEQCGARLDGKGKIGGMFADKTKGIRSKLSGVKDKGATLKSKMNKGTVGAAMSKIGESSVGKAIFGNKFEDKAGVVGTINNAKDSMDKVRNGDVDLEDVLTNILDNKTVDLGKVFTNVLEGEDPDLKGIFKDILGQEGLDIGKMLGGEDGNIIGNLFDTGKKALGLEDVDTSKAENVVSDLASGKDPKDIAKDTIKDSIDSRGGGVKGVKNLFNDAKGMLGGEGGSDIMDTAKDMFSGGKGKGGKMGKTLNKVSKAVGGKGGKALGKADKLMGKAGGALGKVGGKVAGKIGGKLAGKAAAQVGSKVLGGALMATGVGAPLGLLLESPIGGMLMEGAMNLGGKALGAVGGAIGGAGKAIGGFLSNPLGAIGGLFGGGKGVQSGTGRSSGNQGIMGGMGALGLLGGLGAVGMIGGGLMGAIGGLFGGSKGEQKNMAKAQLQVPNLLDKIFNKNKESHGKQGQTGDLVGKILKALLKDKDNNKGGSSGGVNIIIHNININTDDDPEKIKTAFMNLMVELKDQVSPRIVSRTVGEKPEISTGTDTNTTNTTDPNDSSTSDSQNNNNSNSNSSNSNNNSSN